MLTLNNQIELAKLLIKRNGGESELLPLLLELKEGRESALRPATKFLGNSWLEQYMHIQSEINEIRLAMNDYALEYTLTTEFVLDECNDAQISIETLKAIIEPDEQKRRESMIKTIKKNTNREGGSYYESR